MSRRLAVFLVAAFLASFLVGGLLRLYVAAPQPTPPQPTTSSSSPADPLAWYKHLPTATGCPKTVAAGLKPFYPQCPNVSEDHS